MNLINNIKNIKKFIVYKNKILTINNNNVFSDQAKNIQLFDSPVNGFIQFNNKIYINDWSGKYFILDANLNILENGDGKGFYFSSSNYFGCQYLNEFGLNEALIDKNSNAIEFGILNKDSSLNYSTQSFFYFIKENYLHAYALPSAQPLWQFDLGILGEYVNFSNEKCSYEVKFFLGIYNECLLVQLSNATIIWIDSNTGKQKHILNLNESYSLPKPAFYDDSFKAHIVGEKIVFLNNQRLLHINLDSFEVTIIQDYFTQERANQYRFMHNTVFKDKIYFVADYGWQYVTPSYVGVMDANNGEILWKQQLENTGGLSEAPQVSEDKLYIRTNNNVLHIFEKE